VVALALALAVGGWLSSGPDDPASSAGHAHLAAWRDGPLQPAMLNPRNDGAGQERDAPRPTGLMLACLVVLAAAPAATASRVRRRGRFAMRRPPVAVGQHDRAPPAFIF
jgi:hypothetical protein